MDVDFVAVSAIVGALLPLVISFLKQAAWSNTTKKVFAMGVSVLAAVVTTGATQGWDAFTWQNLVTSAAVIISLTQTTYLGFWEDNPVEVRVAGIVGG